MTAVPHIRLITPADAEATLDIYRPFVQHTAVSFEYDVPSIEEWEGRVSEYSATCPWLVCHSAGKVTGYAYAGKHRARSAYAWSADSTIYLSDEMHRSGIAGVLYQTLFDLLRLQGYVNVFAGITLPNAKSEGFHRKMGFQHVGIYKNVGYKFGRWHDVQWLQLPLGEYGNDPAMPVPFSTLAGDDSVTLVLQNANENIARAGSRKS